MDSVAALITPGMERVIVSASNSGFDFSGLILQAHQDAPYVVRYRIEVDAGWRTRDVEVEDGGQRRSEPLATTVIARLATATEGAAEKSPANRFGCPAWPMRNPTTARPPMSALRPIRAMDMLH